MRHQITPTVNVLIINGDTVLLGRRANTGWMDGFLWPPSGHIEANETPAAAALREIQEELGATVDPRDLSFTFVAARKTDYGESVAYVFTIRDKEYSYTNAEPDRCTELVWADLHNLPNDVVEQFKEMVKQGIRHSKRYLELGY